jgi:hypothetical protein
MLLALARRVTVMDKHWCSIPDRVTLTALSLLAAATFSGLLAPRAALACSPARPAGDSQVQLESPLERGREDPCSSR